jgi:hypothetical protein
VTPKGGEERFNSDHHWGSNDEARSKPQRLGPAPRRRRRDAIGWCGGCGERRRLQPRPAGLSLERGGLEYAADSVPPGCHNVAATVESGGMTNGDPNSNNTRYVEAGSDYLPNNDHNPSFGFEENAGDPGTPDSPHSGCLAANTDGTGGGTGTGCGNNPNGAGFSATYDYYQLYCPATAALPLDSIPIPDGVPAAKNCAAGQPIGHTNVTPDTGSNSKLDQIMTQGLLLYLGADDNLDNGEHDGFSGNNHTNGAINGPSDGGAIVLSVTPQNAGNAPTASHPEGLANFSFGMCADGICFGASTQQQTVYHGCDATNPQNKNSADRCAKGTPTNDNVYQNDTPASTKESPNCSSGGPASSETACYTNQDGSANPGGANAYRQHTAQNMNVEPGVQTYQDPDPQRSPVAPFGTPGVYVGTCGVYLNDSGGVGSPGITGQNPGYIGGVSNC